VTNQGQRNGTETIQVYVRKVNDTNGPLKTLRGFKKVELAAGSTADAIIKMPYTALEFYNDAEYKMAVTPGAYELWYGNSSATKDLKKIEVSVL
jgi:beta-glucosidase